MVSNTQASAFRNWTKSLNPLAYIGINWTEFRRAYGAFLKLEPTKAINHIINAGCNSHWQHWVNQRRARQAPHLVDVKVQVDIPELLKLPDFTLGGAYARHIVSNGFDPEAFQHDWEGKFDWVEQRMAISHDVYHIITGFDGTPIGEFGLATFCFVQSWDLLNAFVLSFLPWQMLGNLPRTPQLLHSVLKGLIMGIKSKPVFAYQFELNWEKPVTEVRAELGIASL